MNKIKVLLLLLLPLLATASSCSSAQKQVYSNKSFPIQTFTSVKSDIVGNIVYTQSRRVGVKAQGDRELIDDLMITEKRGVLIIEHKNKRRTKKKRNLTIHISSPTIHSVETEGVGNWTMKGTVRTDNLEIEFEGVGNFEALNLQAKNIKTEYEGVGNLSLGGTTNFLEVNSEGVGNIKTEALKAKTAVIKSTGVGSVKCYASESIDINNSGVGSVSYYGNPKVKNIKNSGIGKVKAKSN